ncbi:ABC transporter ATP-binding protein [Radiobacillus kanasensis]|uniref:ABC transporter ATP-binding protein n=1 Tax=Radiobacillus kanasensis TaxID=2844358 RepID=UPI001E2F6273|nr:ABC transporter ATP-binding protein [Radiobacillus kanasensis]UFT97763.1 ABC transporter ATP-binding protein [Radiobacillus kanasensis]
MIKVEKIEKHFEDHHALRQVSLSIQKGSIYGLLGSNGAGKTTLLKIMMGIYKQEHGKILVDEEEPFENVKLKQKMIFIPDQPHFFSHYTVNQMAGYYKNLYPNWSNERFQKLEKVFNISPNKKVQKLSKGMQRQVAFWLSLSARPEVLLLDEPIDGLDAVMRQKVKNLLIQDVADREMTVVISSHNLREIEDICDHVGIIHQGALMLEKDLDDLKSDIHKIQIAFKQDTPPEFLSGLESLYVEERGSVLLCIVRGKEEEVTAYAKEFQPIIFDLLPLTLEEIFIYEMGGTGYVVESIMDK